MSPLFEDIPKRGLWKRLLLGCCLVVFATAGATSVAAFREVDKIVDALKQNESIEVGSELAVTDPGEPQTIMLLGSDRRPDNATDGGAGAGARSDTIILVRLDPDKGTALMSLPRDLKVEIPGRGTDKINAAYELGGAQLTLKTVKRLTGLSVNHVINVDFRGFKKAIDALGCLYLDIDRRYFNDSVDFAYINLYPGYQRVCGEEALEFARFRHFDSDLVRAARQQEVLREAKQQIGTGKLIGDRDKLIDIFGKYTTSDPGLKDRGEIIRLLTLAVFSVDQPLREVQFDVGEITAGDEAAGVPSYVTASDDAVKKLADQFLGVEDTPGGRGELSRPTRKRDPDGGLYKDPVNGKGLAERTIGKIRKKQDQGLPIYYPTVFQMGSTFTEDMRSYKIKDLDGDIHQAYRMVVGRSVFGEYYGLQGTTWKNPPILATDDFEIVKEGGREFEIHRDGDRVRLVAWRTSKGVYWISNTLLQSLTGRQMLSIARSTRVAGSTR